MATRGKKISEQTLATSLDGNEIIPFAKNGADGAVKASKIKEYVQPDLTAKQDKLVNSDDVTIGIDNKLTVTDLAKKKEFIAQAEAAGAAYNRSTGFFELNGLLDITEAQMRIILRNPQRPPFNVFSSTSQRAKLRTNLWEASPQSTHDITIQSKGVFSGWLAAEVINLDNGGTDVFATKINGYDTFKACMKLHTILGDFSFGNGATTSDTFASCSKLRSFRLYGVNYDIDLHWSPLIAVESLQYLVTNALVSKAKTITLHPDAYARITDELFAQAAEKQINFATTE